MAWPEGRVFAVPLDGGKFGLGRCLIDPVTEFYDVVVTDLDDVDPGGVVQEEVAFTIWVMHRAVNSWKKLDQMELSRAEKGRQHEFFKQDSISKKIVRYSTAANIAQREEPISAAQAMDLECAAVWSASHVVSRLGDHFAGRPNKFWKSMRPKEA